MSLFFHMFAYDSISGAKRQQAHPPCPLIAILCEMRTWSGSLPDVMVSFRLCGPCVGASQSSEHNNRKGFGEQAEKASGRCSALSQMIARRCSCKATRFATVWFDSERRAHSGFEILVAEPRLHG